MPTEVLDRTELLKDYKLRTPNPLEKLKKSSIESKGDISTDQARFSPSRTTAPKCRVAGPRAHPDLGGWIEKCYELEKENRVLSRAISELQLHLPPGVANAVLAEVSKKARNSSRFIPVSRARHEPVRASIDRTESPRLPHAYGRAGTPVYGRNPSLARTESESRPEDGQKDTIDTPRSPPPRSPSSGRSPVGVSIKRTGSPPPRSPSFGRSPVGRKHVGSPPPKSPSFGRSPVGVKRAAGVYVDETRMNKMNRVELSRPRSPKMMSPPPYDDDRKVRFSAPLSDGSPLVAKKLLEDSAKLIPLRQVAQERLDKLYEAIVQKEASEELGKSMVEKLVPQQVE